MYKRSRTPLISAERISNRLDALAQEIGRENFDIVLSVLSGSFMFTADLCRRIATPQLQVAFIKATSYRESMQSGALNVSGLDGLELRGKRVLVIDDILDTGRTMLQLTQKLAAFGATEIKTCVLLNKEARRTEKIHANFVGFDIENEFVVGYGLDYAGDYRTFPEIWTMVEE